MFTKIKIACRIGLAVLIGAGLLSRTADASMTDPTLFLSRAVEFEGTSNRLVRIEGEFPWEALLQSGYPLQLVIWTNAVNPDFVRFDLHGNAVTGVTATLEGGLTPAEAAGLFAIGEASDLQHLIHVGPGRIEARLGAPFMTAPLRAQIFVLDNGTIFVSNPISFSPVAP